MGLLAESKHDPEKQEGARVLPSTYYDWQKQPYHFAQQYRQINQFGSFLITPIFPKLVRSSNISLPSLSISYYFSLGSSYLDRQLYF